MAGKSVRQGRILGAVGTPALMVAADRTVSGGDEPYAEDPELFVQRVVDIHPDAVLLGPGLIDRYGHLFGFRGAPGLVCRLDFPYVDGPFLGSGNHFDLICDVAHAASLGADAVVLFLKSHPADRALWSANIRALSAVIREAELLQIPVIVEAVAWDSPNHGDVRARETSRVARIACELGADIIKTDYPGSVEQMQRLVTACSVPVLVLGGPLRSVPEVVGTTAAAIAGGARGVIYGRNIWQREHADGVAAELRRALASYALRG
ncbi:MAG: class I fructose-bisphosphate aldolase [Propioniciclava sp.]